MDPTASITLECAGAPLNWVKPLRRLRWDDSGASAHDCVFGKANAYMRVRLKWPGLTDSVEREQHAPVQRATKFTTQREWDRLKYGEILRMLAERPMHDA